MPVERQHDPDRWVEQYGDYLFRYAMLRLRDPERAEDAVQETFLAALRGRDSFSGESSEKTWLVAILKHKIIDHFRRVARERPTSDLADTPDAADALYDKAGEWKSPPANWDMNPGSVFEKREFWQAFQKCLSGLPARQADAFVLREFEGLSTDEICNILAVTPTNLGVLLHRARQRLRYCLEVNWFGSPA